MDTPQSRPAVTPSDTMLLIFFGATLALLHIAVNGQYGFHRDELLSLGAV